MEARFKFEVFKFESDKVTRNIQITISESVFRKICFNMFKEILLTLYFAVAVLTVIKPYGLPTPKNKCMTVTCFLLMFHISYDHSLVYILYANKFGNVHTIILF